MIYIIIENNIENNKTKILNISEKPKEEIIKYINNYLENLKNKYKIFKNVSEKSNIFINHDKENQILSLISSEYIIEKGYFYNKKQLINKELITIQYLEYFEKINIQNESDYQT